MKKLKLFMLSFVFTCLMGMTASAAGASVEFTYGTWGGSGNTTPVQTASGEVNVYFEVYEATEEEKFMTVEEGSLYFLELSISDEEGAAIIPTTSLTEAVSLKINIPEITGTSYVGAFQDANLYDGLLYPNVSGYGDGYVIVDQDTLYGTSVLCLWVTDESNYAEDVEAAYDLVSREPMTVNLEGEGAATIRFEADKTVTADAQSRLTVGSGYSVYFLDVMTVKMENGTETVLDEAKFAEPVTLRLYSSAIESSKSKVKVYHFNGVAWDDSPQVIKVEKNYVDVMFTELSPIAIAVDNSVSSSAKKSSGSSGSGSSAAEEVRFTTALSPAAEVGLASGAADLQIGPPTRTFYESDGQALLGTTEPVSVYLADFWLVDRATGAVVTPGADGAVATINIPGVTASSKVMIRQWPYGTDEYVDFAPVEVGNGYIKVKFTAMSQAAICVAGADAAVTADTAATAVTTEKVSPKTSDSVLIYAAEAVALVSILGFVVCRKKSA